VIDHVQAGEDVSGVALAASAYLAVIIGCTFVILYVCEVWANIKDAQVQAKIEREIYDKAINTDYAYIDNPQYFDGYKAATEQYSQQAKLVFERVVQVVRSFMTLASIITLMAALEPMIVAFAIAGTVCAVCFQMAFVRTEARQWEETVPPQRKRDYLSRILYDKSRAADMRTNGIAGPLFDHYDKASDGLIGVFKKYRLKLFGLYAAGGWQYYAVQAATMVYVAFGLISGRIESLGVYATLIAASEEFCGFAYTFTERLTQTAKAGMFAEKVRSFFELRSDIEPPSGGAVPPAGAMSLELHGVSFRYPNSEFALNGVNISVKPGEKIAIVGENGAGKTTLAKLLLRLYDCCGEIMYNGINVREYDVRALRRQIGVAFQEPQLYALTVRDNMQVYRSASDETLREALKSVGLDIELDAAVTREFGENGMMFSGGQAQKLGLSRLLFGDFGLLLLDEPSSALDPLAEYEMTKLIFDCSKTTTIMVAHRLSAIRTADRIYLIANGKVAEQGTHDELMALAGKYAEMFAKQAENYVR
jgi:ATP-binding cassette subfamily B protein